MKALLQHLASARAAGRGPVPLADLALLAAVLSAAALLVAPVPPWLLDLCLAGNLAFAATILVASLLAAEALDLASFPVLLLFTTLFRLAASVSATRLVLSRGEAGAVIAAFGEVVVAGSYVTGAVVYAVVTLAQLLVVARGAERVAEVAARFTLDALPGKQMSIDAELRAGAIDAAEARLRRRKLEREGQLHGAMDGALKFVKGDAVASVAIVLVNVVGGLATGLGRGLPLGAAARRYTSLAIGDGLTAQVPALLVSLAAGVVVTRVAAEEEGAPLAGALASELLADPRVTGAAASLSLLLAALPGLPAWPFLAVGVAAALLALRASRLRPGRRRGREPSRSPLAGPVPDRPGVGPSPLTLELAADLAALALPEGGALAGLMWPALREELQQDLGLRPPELEVRVRDLPGGSWRLLIDDVPAARGRAPAAEAVALLPAPDLEAVGIRARPETDPLTGLPVSCIAASDAGRAGAVAPLRGPLERLAAALAAALRVNAHLLLGAQDVQSLLDDLEATQPALVREASRQLPAPLLAEVLRRLLEEGVPIRPLRALLEALLVAGGACRGAEALAETGRRALRRQLAHRLAPGGRALEALLVDPAAEVALRKALSSGVDRTPLDAAAAGGLVSAAGEQLAGLGPERRPVVLASAEVRRALRDLLAPAFPCLPVLAYDELPPAQPVLPLGRIGLGAQATPPAAAGGTPPSDPLDASLA